MINPLLEYFNKKQLSPRSKQTDCLNWLNDNINKYKYFILQLPTGVGKTHISLSLSEYNKKNLYISSTNQLLSQYMLTDKDLVEIKGAQQYTCNVDSSLNCGNAPCKTNRKLKEQCLTNNICEYYNKRQEFICSKMGLTNYAFAVASAGCGIFSEEYANVIQGGLKLHYDHIVCDEAHNLENHLIGFSTININLEDLVAKNIINPDYLIENHPENSDESWKNILDICIGIENDIKARLKYLEGKINKSSSNKIAVKKLWNEYYYIDRLAFPIRIILQYPLKDKWVLEINEHKNEFKITPINVDFIFKKYLDNLGSKFIFMSATIGDTDVFIKSLGLEKDKCAFYECDSPFEANKSPIVILERLDLSYKNIDNELQKCLQYVETIAKKHKTENGIIHTGNYKIAKYIYENASRELQNKLVFKEKYNNINNTGLIGIHEQNVSCGINSVLLSPSLIEGVDLKDDLSRWQIIIKLPFASLADKRTKFLADSSPSWYVNDTVKKIIQAAGRSTRHTDDHSITYILDKTTTYIFNKIKLPQWFKNRIVIK